MNYFTITTSRETADKIEKVLQSDILMSERTLKLGKISHQGGWSTVQILANTEDGQINSSDIFWLGYYTGDMHKR